MSTLITGHKGYVGSRLANKIQSICPDRELGCLDRKCNGDGYDHDINAKNFGFKGWKPDIVYHLAAQSGAIPSWDDPYQDAMDNIMATIRICEMFPDAKIIFTTSGAALEPESPYGLSKSVAEKYLSMLHNNVVTLRLSSVYGEKDRGVVDTFIKEDACTIYGDGSAVRDFVHVDDIVDALIKAKDWEPGEYSLGSGIGTSIQEIAEATGKPIRYVDSREGEKQEVVLKNTSPQAKLYGFPIEVGECIEESQAMKSWEPKINVIDYVKQNCR